MDCLSESFLLAYYSAHNSLFWLMLIRCIALSLWLDTSWIEVNPQEANASPLFTSNQGCSINTQLLPDIAAIRMTYLMYYVALIYTCDSVQWVKDAVDTDRHRRHHSTYGMINIILLISRDAIHFWLFAGTLIGLLLSYNQLIRTRWITRVNI